MNKSVNLHEYRASLNLRFIYDFTLHNLNFIMLFKQYAIHVHICMKYFTVLKTVSKGWNQKNER
jgi:hypothetical protein